MDKDSLVKLLNGILVPNTEHVKAVTAELQKNYYTKPESLLLLIEIALTNEEPGIRKLASIQAARQLPKHWSKIDVSQKNLARAHLLEGTIKGESEMLRQANARLIALMVYYDMNDEKTKNKAETTAQILSLCNNDDAQTREVGLFIVYSIMELDPTLFMERLADVLQILNWVLSNPSSNHMKHTAVQTLGSVLLIVDHKEADMAHAMPTFIPHILDFIKVLVHQEDSDMYPAVFESLAMYLTSDTSLMGSHFLTVIQFMMELASVKEVPADARCLAIEYLSQCVKNKPIKVQNMQGICTALVVSAMKIITELETDDDDDDDDTGVPPHAAMILIDNMSQNLSPELVIDPLIAQFMQFSEKTSPAAYRSAGILALGGAAEGAPDFMSEHLGSLLPRIFELLNDADDGVRRNTLTGILHIGDELSEELAKQHKPLITGLIKNLETAVQAPPTKKNIGIITASCDALDAVGDAIKDADMQEYAFNLLSTFGKLLGHHSDFGVKISAARAIGSIAVSLGSRFKEYFAEVINVLAPCVVDHDESHDGLSLRSAACESMARIAGAVGAETFQPYLEDLMRASKQALELDNSRLKETSFILWSMLASVYGKDFAPYLPLVFSGLFACLDQEEEDEINEDELHLLENAALKALGGSSSKNLKEDGMDDGSDDDDDNDDDNDDVLADGDDDDDDDDAWKDEDYGAVTAIALEKEYAIDTLADVIANSCDEKALNEYVSVSMEKLRPLTKHSYDGVSKSAITAYWRIYGRVWDIWEKSTGQKWQRGTTTPPQQDILRMIGAQAVDVTMDAWLENPERAVITQINQHVAATLKACGPAILYVTPGMLDQTVEILESIISHTHPCQLIDDDDDDDNTEHKEVEEDSSEYGWLVVDTALDVVVGLSAALGPSFLDPKSQNLWKKFEGSVLKFVSSKTKRERSTAVGVIADIIKYMGNAITPFTAQLQSLLNLRLADEDKTTKSNAVYGMGQLIACSDDTSLTVPTYGQLWELYKPLLEHEDDANLIGNTVGSLARMIIRNPDANFVAEVFPHMVNRLPLKVDYEENEPTYQAIYTLYQAGNPTVQQFTPQLVNVFEQVLSEADEQLEDETRQLVKQTVQSLAAAHPEMAQSHPNLINLVSQ